MADESEKKSGKRNLVETTVVLCIFLFVIGCSSIPIFVYATSADIDGRQDDLGVTFDLINCSSQQVSAGLSTAGILILILYITLSH